MSGNLINLGNWDQCKSSGGKFRGRHCLLYIVLDKERPQDISYVPHNVPIIYSLCVPEICAASELTELLSKEISVLGTNSSTLVVKCSLDDPSWGVWEIAGGSALTVLSLIIVSSTALDVFWTDGYKGYNGLFTSFSVRRNWAMLPKTKKTPFSCLDGLKTFLQFSVIAYHTWRDILRNAVPVVNKFSLNELLRSYRSFVAQMPIMVDSFFVISGCLVMFSLLSKKAEKTSIWRTLINRVLRVYPAYFVILLAETSLTGFICDGPLCTTIVRKKQDNCRQYWWYNVFLIHNIHPGIQFSCLPPSWYIAVDIQLFVLFVPLIAYGIGKNVKATMWFIGGLAGCSVIAVFIQVLLMNLGTDTLAVENIENENLYMVTLYTQVHSRLSSWAIGLLLGAFMRRQESKKITVKKELAIALWILVGLTVSGFLLLSVPMQKEDYVYNNVIAAFYNALWSPVWCLGNCWIIFACCSGYSDCINPILSSKPLRILGKLSYCAFMVHQLVVNLLFSELRAPIYITSLQQATLIFGAIVISYLFATVLYLTVEGPFVNVQSFTQGIGRSKAKESAAVTARGQESSQSSMGLSNSTVLDNFYSSND
ncbi:transferase activity, transferring acyl groups other than amino-acyl groups [Nesidiocoris tenuis]|uniref:Transferase activity, transferring acyl groups other than amino-acyl groups n=1 Tax=Nesidiocoris tenuis TaxID=355587 RepID=A0ABN7B4I6_9HEMI|nr:transferase activity, transferring acyl groups other than amino-acyl groups [Nesidiocoris tenuis]